VKALLSEYFKQKRDKFKLTQRKLAMVAGVGLRFIRDIEQGKKTLRMDKVNQVLKVFGTSLEPADKGKKRQEKKIIKRDVFEKELALCRLLSKKENILCSWGRCQDCGVIPLLYKLHKGELLEDQEKILAVKRSVLDGE
jgi:y4mF family transcriptional regulator